MTKNYTNPPAPGSISARVDARQFATRLKLIAKHAELSASAPILACVTIEFDPGAPLMRLSHYGVDMNITATLTAEGTGAVAVPLKTLLSFVAGADGETLAIEKNQDSHAVTFTCGRFSAALFPLAVEDTPRLSMPAPSRSFAMGEGVLHHLLSLTLPFVSTEETRYYLNGVCFELETDKVRVIATDGHRLGTREASTPAPLEHWDYRPIVPRLAAAALFNIVGTKQGFAHFFAEYREATNNPLAGFAQKPAGWYQQRAQFTCEGWTITTKLIDGTFPDWRRVVPKNEGRPEAVIAGADIERFRRIVGGIGKGWNRMKAVRFSPAETGGVALKADRPGDGAFTGEAAAELTAPFDPFGCDIGYLAAMPKAFGSKKLRLAIGRATDPIIIAAPESPASEFAILMPMRV
ncbi:DNA polymerase-3 subunit beta [Sinorhizobium medicae]